MRVETPLPWKDANNSKWQPLNVAAFFYAKMTAGSIGFPIESASQWQSDQSVHEDGEILSMVCRFYNSDGAMLGWWLSCCIFLSKNSDFRPWKNSDRCLIKKKKILNIHCSINSDRHPLQWREDHPLCAISFLKNPPSTLNLLPNTLKPASQPPP